MRLHRHDEWGPPGDEQTAGWLPAAGIPWFVTLFGRDSLIVSLQTLVLSPQLAVASLRALAALQGDDYDDSRDVQPGKVLHELRHGELAHLHLVMTCRSPSRPHDNALIANGFHAYAHHDEAWRIARGLFDAAARFQYQRLPEVFAGLDRDAGSFPVQYPGANVPQA